MTKNRGARKPGEPRLYAAKEAAAALGVHQTNLCRLKDIPEPYATVTVATLWRADEIDELAKARHRAKQAADMTRPKTAA